MDDDQNKTLSLRASKAPDGRARIVASIGDRELLVDVVDLWSDTDRDRLADAIHRACPAIPVADIQRRLLVIDRENLPASDESSESAWDDPGDIDRPDLFPLPVGCFPDRLRLWVESAAEAFQVPLDLPGVLSLAACSGMVARRIEIEPSAGWIEPLNLYVAALLDPANRKSAAFRAAFEPVRLIEHRLMEAAKPEIAKQTAERRIDEKRLANLEKKASIGDASAMREASQLAIDLNSVPIPAAPRLILDDATSEAVEIALAAQGGRLIVSGCEGGLFDVMAGRYSSGAANLDVFLKGHAGDDLRVDRVNRGSLIVERCCLTLAYAIQPEVMRGLADKPSFRGRGLIGRFLYAFPSNILGRRRIDAMPIPSGVADQYGVLIENLFELGARVDGDTRRLRLSSGASTCFREWRTEVERMLGDAGRLADLRDWGGKLPGLTARIAGVFHLVQNSESIDPSAVPISGETFERSIELSRWAVDHAEAVLSLMGAPCEMLNDAAYVLRWMRARGVPQVTRRDIAQHGRARFDGDPGRLDRCLMTLMDRGWIRGIESADRRPGRPSVAFEVNPRVMGDRSVGPPVIPSAIVIPKPSGGRVRGVI